MQICLQRMLYFIVDIEKYFEILVLLFSCDKQFCKHCEIIDYLK